MNPNYLTSNALLLKSSKINLAKDYIWLLVELPYGRIYSEYFVIFPCEVIGPNSENLEKVKIPVWLPMTFGYHLW